MPDAIFIAIFVAIFYLGRFLHYRQVFGRWVWWRLRPDEIKRLLPRDSQSAYMRGYREGQAAALASRETQQPKEPS